MGPNEELLRGHFQTMIGILQTPSDDPMGTAQSLGEYLQAGREEILGAAYRVNERIVGMSPAERMYYEELWADYFGPVSQLWWSTLRDFREGSPEAGTMVDGLMTAFD
jgi:hypothetical protein